MQSDPADESVDNLVLSNDPEIKQNTDKPLGSGEQKLKKIGSEVVNETPEDKTERLRTL